MGRFDWGFGSYPQGVLPNLPIFFLLSSYLRPENCKIFQMVTRFSSSFRMGYE